MGMGLGGCEDDDFFVDEHRLMDKGGNGPWWESRDYGLPCIPCSVRGCPANSNGKCEMPSAIKIGSDGVCELGKKAMDGNG